MADAIAGPLHADPAKARVMAYFRRLVVEGHAEWHMLENGDIRLRFRTGETYLLAKTTVIRMREPAEVPMRLLCAERPVP
ncbi:hypothetical protein I6F35_08275 [Bradyrhizobium sp. BRP22]|uniref:hypothetical protein n=1 Tax=Bradyrhizobium sp. BRP22 TaxID=2793821 RepID=UPI001CD31F19|nr:hypothetical protein [Bradyrhizobium sp. BRP22]MCA1453210.1 hypothetical protein [Bradyrhizobium sp. BRP22]